MFAHCDVNAFYASCQTAFRPDLKGRPVVVLSNNDGCVIARSAEAKPFVKMGEPYFKQKAAFLRHGVVAFSSNYELYADMSSRVMATLEELTPRCEIYSIDEAFCDVSGVRHCRDLTDFGREIRATVLQRTHLTLGVGIAPTKTLAKLANHAAKQWPRQTGGVVDLSCPQRQRKLMALLPVSEVWGIGRRIGKKLEAMGIGTVLQLAESDIRFIRKHFTVVLERTVRELRGEPCLALEEFAPAKQEIICSRSFGDRITAYEDMRQAICSYAARAAEKLRGEHQYCRFVSAFVKTSPFALNEPYYGNSASLKLLTPTQDSGILSRGDELSGCHLESGASLSEGRRDARRFLQPGRRPAESVRRACSAAKQRQTDAGSRSAECEKRQGGALFCRPGDPAAVADEARDALAALHHAIRRPAPRQITRAIPAPRPEKPPPASQ